MQPNEVKIGGHYHIRVSGKDYAIVEVLEDTQRGAARYIVRRLDTGAILRKPRGAGALHIEPGPWGLGGKPPAKKAKGLQLSPPERAAPMRTAPPKATKKVATDVNATQADLLKKFAKMPAETKQFIADLFKTLADDE